MKNDSDNQTISDAVVTTATENVNETTIQTPIDASVQLSAENIKQDKKKKKKSHRKSPLLLAVGIIALLSIAFNIFFVLRYRIRIEMIDGKPTILSQNQFDAIKRQAKEQVEDELTSTLKEDIRETIKKRLIAGDSSTYLLRVYYPEYIVYMDEGIYRFTAINNELKKNNLEKSYFKIDDNKEITYSDNCITSIKGIDVSKYQGNINFTKVKESGVDYAMIRCGFRGYGNGALAMDSNFHTYAKNATAAGLDIGVYFFSQAISKEEAVEEANYVLNAIKDYDVTYPIAIDIEDVAGSDGRQETLTPAQLTDVVIAFCDTIKAAGYTPMIYSNTQYFAGKVEYERLEAYDKWFASYSTQLYFPYEISMWQYTNTGSVDGINGDVDMNISFKKYSQ